MGLVFVYKVVVPVGHPREMFMVFVAFSFIDIRTASKENTNKWGG
jgi:hypothetical protein